MSCEHKRVLDISAKASDCQCFSVPHLAIEHDGYAPDIDELCFGDYIEFSICLDCGTVVGFRPMSDEEITQVFEDA